MSGVAILMFLGHMAVAALLYSALTEETTVLDGEDAKPNNPREMALISFFWFPVLVFTVISFFCRFLRDAYLGAKDSLNG